MLKWIPLYPPVKNFNPLGFSKKANEASVGRDRESDIMHGRFAQMAPLNWGDDYVAPYTYNVLESTPALVILALALVLGLE